MVSVLAMTAAGMTVVIAGVVLDAAPAGAVSVADSAAFRTAWSDTITPVTQIDLTADITMSGDCNTWARNGGSSPSGDIVVDGHGFALDATGCNKQALYSGATNVTLQDVTVKGGAFDCNCVHGGGGVQVNLDLTLINSAVINNVSKSTVANASAYPFGGGIYSAGTVTLINSTVANNTVQCLATCGGANSGGIQADTIVATNSTISNNTVDEGGFSSPPSADYAGGMSANSITLTYTTVADNSASDGANLGFGGVAPMVSFASVIANPLGGGVNCVGVPSATSKFSFEEATDTCGFGAGVGDVENGADPSLASLAGNGGLAVGETRKPLNNSPLLDVLLPSECDDDSASTIVPMVDQREVGRPRGSGCDIGAVEAPAGTFHPLVPTRILDTRTGNGLSGAFAPQQTRTLLVTTVGGVPSNATAVLLNVTATGATKNGWLTVFPADASLPTASNLNFKAGQTVPNLVVVRVGAGTINEDLIKINNTGGNAQAGTVHVVADVMGYYNAATGSIDDGFTGLTPVRILDTRNGTGLAGVFAPQQTRSLVVGGVSGVPADADAVVMNVTATGPTKRGWLTVFPADASLPTASNLNFVAGQTVANLVTVKLGTVGVDDNNVKINNTGGSTSAGTVNVVADVVGYYKTSSGGPLTSLTPTRILDTRNGTGGVTGPVSPQATITVNPQTAGTMPPVGTYTAVVVNVTATAPAKNGWLTVFPSNASLPMASTLNFTAGGTVPNLVKINVGPDGKFKINNTGGNANAGNVQIVVDIVGYYTENIIL